MGAWMAWCKGTLEMRDVRVWGRGAKRRGDDGRSEQASEWCLGLDVGACPVQPLFPPPGHVD